MANWDNLKAAIQDVIKENGNEEITGQVLQNTLLSIVNNLGENATFAGLATPRTNPGTPDGVIFYIATQQGTYQYFNNLAINKGETAIFLYKTSWTKISVAVAPPVLQNSGTSSNDVMSQNAVTTIVGIDDVPQFSDQTSYKTGEFVRYTGLIFKFTAAHSAGAWKGTDTTPSNLAEYIKATTGNTQAKAVTLEKAPYIMHMYYYPLDGGRWRIALGEKIILLDVSNVLSIQFADTIPLSDLSSTVRMYMIWFDENKSALGNKVISAGGKVNLPPKAKYVFLEAKFDDNDLIGNYWLSVELRDNVGFSEEQLYTIPDVWDGRTYTINKTFFPVGSVGNRTELTDNNTASLYVRKCPNINRFRYTNSQTSDVRELYFNGINRDNIWEWEQAESNEHKEYYLRCEEGSDNNTYYFPVEEMMCRGKVHISPAPAGGNSDWFTINMFDKGNNLIATSLGDKNTETEFDYLEFTNKVVDTRRLVKDFNQGYANLYLTEEPTNDFVQPTGSNLVTKYNLINAHVYYRNNRLNPKIQSTNIGGAVMYVPCEAGETYMVGDAIKGNGIANESMRTTNPVIFLDENKSIVSAFTQEQVTYLKGFSTFWNIGDGNMGYNGYIKFTAPAGAKYMYIQVAKCLTAYKGYITDYPVIVCKEKDILAAIKTAEKLIYPGVVTGAEISLPKRNTFKNIWILGDSLAGGYGNLSTFEGSSIPGWLRYFAEAVKPKSVYNSSAGGYTLTDASKTFVDNVVQSPSNSFVALLENTISRYNEQPEVQHGIPTPDYVFICGCANDMGKTRGTSVTGNFSGVSYINEADMQSEDINPDSLSYDDLMDNIFIRHNVDNVSYLNEMNEVPIFKIAGAVRYIVLRVGNLFPNCKFVVSTNLINAQSFSYSAQENCNKELRWIANRLSIPVVDVARRSNTPPLWEYKNQGVETLTHRFLADGVHFYGGQDSTNKGFNTSAAMRMGYLFAAEFERICEYDSVQNIETFDFTTYPHDKNVIYNS